MKRFFKVFLIAFIAILSFTLGSCSEETKTPPVETPTVEVTPTPTLEHVHTPNAKWERDSAGHWHECDECGELIEMNSHTMSEYTKVEGECKEQSSCTVCGYTTSKTIPHEFVDGLCTGCGLEEGNYDVLKFYVRGTINSWGSPAEHELQYSPKTKTATITVTLPAGAKFKIADDSWATEFHCLNTTYEEGLFEADTEDAAKPNFIVVEAGDYIFTVSGYDTEEYTAEIKVACKHQYGPETPVAGKQCNFTKTCTLCGTVDSYVRHTLTGDDIICDVCEHVDLKVYYVKGSFNEYSANEEYVLQYDETTHTATVDLWLQVGHSFKIGTASGWEFGYDVNALDASAKDAFISDAEGNYYCVAKGEDILGVKFTLVITGLNTLNHTLNISTEEEYSVESVDLPQVSAGIFVVGTMNSWTATDGYGLSTKDGKTIIENLTLAAGDEFKVANSDYSTEYNYDNSDFEAGLFTAGGEYGNNLVVVTSGKYNIIIEGTTCTITLAQNDGGNTNPDQGGTTPVMSDLYFVGTKNTWNATAAYALQTINGVNTITLKLNAGDEFKIKKSLTSWDVQYHYLSGTFDATYFEQSGDEADRPNIKVKVAGEYKITVSGTKLLAERIGDYTCVSSETHTMVDASCEVAKHCSVSGCGYSEGQPLGHKFSTEGTQGAGVIIYPCTNPNCNATKEEITDIEQVEGTVLYLDPNSNWEDSNPRYAVYTWDGGEQWFDMSDSNGDGIYEVVIPEGISNIIFVRMNPSTTTNNWNNKWNQTSDLKVPTDGTNLYTVKENTWDKGGGSWSTK